MNRRFATERNWNLLESLQAFAASRDMTLHELALSWLAAQPVVASIIAGASNPDQLEQNFKAATRVLAPVDKGDLDAIIAA